MFELASIIFFGILAQWIAWKIKVPAILPLIIIGLFVGPLSFLWTGNNPDEKWIQPIFHDGQGILPAKNFFYFVSLSIGIILFEGGLTLNRKEIKGIGQTIINLITVGTLVTLIGGALAAHFIMELSWSISFLFSALIIVTGPTVIAPILRNLALKRNVSAVLKWEGILIDPVGALMAVLVFEFIRSGAGSQFGFTALLEFGRVVSIGVGVGFLSALAFRYMLLNKLVPNYLLNVFTLAVVLFVFVISDEMAHESGLLTVVVMGTILGNMNIPHFKEILHFKESLSILLISILFIELSANINLEDLMLLLDIRCLLLFLFVILVLRPVGVFLSTYKADNLNFREKAFISWVGPRGIVAAGIASLFGMRLQNDNVPGAEYITPLVFMIVLGTVLLNATTARILARLLKVVKEASDGILIVGANSPARLIGRYLNESGRHVILLDRSEYNTDAARNMGLEAIQADVYSDDLSEKFDLLDVGYLMAMTASKEVNKYARDHFRDEFGENGSLRILSADEYDLRDEIDSTEILFGKNEDFINLSEIARDYPEFHEIEVDNKEHFENLLTKLRSRHNSIPLFYKKEDNKLEIINADMSIEWEKEDKATIVYLGKELKKEDLPYEQEVVVEEEEESEEGE